MSYVNVNGVWKNGTDYVNVNGLWKQKSGIYTNVNGVWKSDNPYGKVNITHVTYRQSGGGVYSAGWNGNVYSMRATTGSATDDDIDRLYAGTGVWNWTLENAVDQFEMTFTYSSNKWASGTIQAGIIEKIPGANGYYWYPDIGVEHTISSNMSNVSVTTSKKRWSGTNYNYLGSFYLVIDLYSDWSDVTVNFSSVKLNGYEILV